MVTNSGAAAMEHFVGMATFGQYCIVMPEQDTVIAITSGVKDMQAVLNLIWDKLLPAMDARRWPPTIKARTSFKSN